MSEIQPDETWRLVRQVLKERDTARAELDTLRLLTVEALRERDEARTLARECHEILCRFVRTDGVLHRERWEEIDRLRDKLLPHGWLQETPALGGEPDGERRCPSCGLRLVGSQP